MIRLLFVIMILSSFTSSANSSGNESATALLWAYELKRNGETLSKEIIDTWGFVTSSDLPPYLYCSTFLTLKLNQEKARERHREVMLNRIKIIKGELLSEQINDSKALRKHYDNYLSKIIKDLDEIKKFQYMLKCYQNTSLDVVGRLLND